MRGRGPTWGRDTSPTTIGGTASNRIARYCVTTRPDPEASAYTYSWSDVGRGPVGRDDPPLQRDLLWGPAVIVVAIRDRSRSRDVDPARFDQRAGDVDGQRPGRQRDGPQRGAVRGGKGESHRAPVGSHERD